MNKKEILEKSGKENKGMDEMELSALYRSGYVASIVGGFLCICLALLESALMHKINNGTWIVFLAMDAAAMLTKYFYSRKKEGFNYRFNFVYSGCLDRLFLRSSGIIQ